MQDRSPLTRQNLLATHGRTIHLGQNGKARSEHISSALPPEADMVACHDTQFIAAKVSTTERLLTLMMPMPG